jgi:hypothetical protein
MKMPISWLVRFAALVLLVLAVIGCTTAGVQQNKAGQAALRQRSWPEAEREFERRSRQAPGQDLKESSFHSREGNQ